MGRPTTPSPFAADAERPREEAGVGVFWDAAAELDVAALALNEGRRFPLCQPDALARVFTECGLREVQDRALDVPTLLRDFDDYWTPFTGGQGPAPGDAMSLDEARRAALRERIREKLPVADDGSVALVAWAWAVHGRMPSWPVDEVQGPL